MTLWTPWVILQPTTRGQTVAVEELNIDHLFCCCEGSVRMLAEEEGVSFTGVFTDHWLTDLRLLLLWAALGITLNRMVPWEFICQEHKKTCAYVLILTGFTEGQTRG